jgi:DEAD/DEAH box helicase domain-containing protein
MPILRRNPEYDKQNAIKSNSVSEQTSNIKLVSSIRNKKVSSTSDNLKFNPTQTPIIPSKSTVFDPSQNIRNLLTSNDWTIQSEELKNEEEGKYFDINLLNISDISKKYINLKYKKGIYNHQKLCIENSIKGADVCLSTSTASGKTLSFQIVALELLSKNSNSRVIAIYPIKALATEQEKKWKELFVNAGLDIKVGRIDGSIKDPKKRIKFLEECQLIIMTPDVAHAWLLSPAILEKKVTLNFLKNLSLVIVDEAHVYSGVFGSNSLFLFRELEHLCELLNNRFKYIVSSATIKDPQYHLRKLFGRNFTLISNKYDSSSKNKVNIFFINPPENKDINISISELITSFSEKEEFNIITFADARKRVENLATISDRNNNDKSKIMPYRSGLEEEDRLEIQNKLSSGELKAIISTSALEMGIDIPYLNMAILVGVPASQTSLLQRIGRIGRHSEGYVLIINDGSFSSRNIFRDTTQLFNLPLNESTLYMDNTQIQYQHAICLSGKGGAHDTVASKVGKYTEEFESKSNFPQSFIDLCNKERAGDIHDEFLYKIKSELGNDPNKNAPLRHCEDQYKIFLGRNGQPMGTLTESQMMREAYPGAIYYYLKTPYRVVKVYDREKVIDIRREYHQYHTSPKYLGDSIYPNMSSINIYKMDKYNDLLVFECKNNIEKIVAGYTEIRGSVKEDKMYPIEGVYDKRLFKSFLNTTGVILKHPSMNNSNFNSNAFAKILFEAYLITVPFERHDISFGFDKFNIEKSIVNKGDNFICIYDSNPGSLRLTNHLTNTDILKETLNTALEIALNDSDSFEDSISNETIEVIKILVDCVNSEKQELYFEDNDIKEKSDKRLVIIEGSSGLVISNGNQEFFIKKVFYKSNGELYYKGYYNQDAKPSDLAISIPALKIFPIEGKSLMGYYDEDEDIVIPV